MANNIQRLYWGMLGRRQAVKQWIQVSNDRLEQSKRRAKRELSASNIQRIYRGHVVREYVILVRIELEKAARRKALVNRMTRVIQRLARGRHGRVLTQRRKEYLQEQALRWAMSINVQRVYRGHVGRMLAAEARRLREIRRRHAAATVIQRHFRGFRGRALAAIARALKILRAKHQEAALEIQRYMRGCLARSHVKHHRVKVERERLELRSSISIQRIFRGHKGREAREIEMRLNEMEVFARPLLAKTKTLEAETVKVNRLINRLEDQTQRMEENIVQGHRELDYALHTTAKFTDCTRINGIPQRYLTKYLRIRLKDHLEHEEVCVCSTVYGWFSRRIC